MIRRYVPSDAKLLSALYRRSVEALGPRAYSPPQVAAWAKLAPSPARLAELMGDGRTRLVALDGEGAPAGFADLEPRGRIHFFYMAPEAAGRGLGSKLYKALEASARARGMTCLSVEASAVALPFFRKHGFQVRERRDFVVGGLAIHNFAAEKEL